MFFVSNRCLPESQTIIALFYFKEDVTIIVLRIFNSLTRSRVNVGEDIHASEGLCVANSVVSPMRVAVLLILCIGTTMMDMSEIRN